jgi:hypothetical protein
MLEHLGLSEAESWRVLVVCYRLSAGGDPGRFRDAVVRELLSSGDWALAVKVADFSPAQAADLIRGVARALAGPLSK